MIEEKSEHDKKSLLQVLEEKCTPKWWKVRSGRREGFASKHYFVHKGKTKAKQR